MHTQRVTDEGMGLYGLRKVSGSGGRHESPGLWFWNRTPTPDRLVFAPSLLVGRHSSFRSAATSPPPRFLLGVSCSLMTGQRVTGSLENNRLMKSKVDELVLGHIHCQGMTGNSS